MLLATVLISALCLAYANGANDNFKGVATLFGSGTTNYRGAILWATVCTLLGSIAAVMLARTLIAKFTGKGLVPVDLATEPAYGAAVALGAGLTVLMATRLGMPVSTTHGLVGALVGAGWAAEAAIDYGRLGNGFFAPLLVSPLLAIMVTVIVYPVFRVLRRRLNVSENSCVCVTDEMTPMTAASSDAAAIPVTTAPVVSVGTSEACRLEASDTVSGTTASGLLDQLHFLSAGVVSFARGLNDTPKIAALLLIIPALGGAGALALVGLFIAVGGVISARRVAETMSHRITNMNHGQGFTANVITGAIVIGASRLGLPVSTTHVSCGSLFGIGTVTGQAHWRTIGTILLAWAVTLPMGALLGGMTFVALSRLP